VCDEHQQQRCDSLFPQTPLSSMQTLKAHCITHTHVHGASLNCFTTLCRAVLCAAGKARKRTEEGYAVYSEEELGLGKKGGGDTPQCPFDCDCCF
jgi:hypothetical protein